MDRQRRQSKTSLDEPSMQERSPVAQHLFHDALQHHQAGRLPDAERLYRQVLAAEPNHADSLHLLGVVAYQTQRHDAAVAIIGKAIMLNGKVAAYHSNLGNVLKAQGRLDAAAACYRRAIHLSPDYADAHNNLGSTLRAQGQLDEAAVCYRRAIDLNPNYAHAHNHLGHVLMMQGRLEDATAAYRRAIDLNPRLQDAHNHLGTILKAQGRLEEAAASCRRALALNPNSADAHNNLGNVLKEQGRFEDAVASYRRAIALKPELAEAYNSLGTALLEQGCLEEAGDCHRMAIALKPDYPEAHNNLGTVFTEQRRMQQAADCYRKAIAVKPDYAEAHTNLATVLLSQGSMREGWVEFEWRLKTPKGLMNRRDFAQPQWRGEAVPGQTLLIHADRGYSDSLQFCRYATLAAARGLRVMIEVPGPLVRLMRGLPRVDRVVVHGEVLPPFDLHCPMMSLPLAMGTTLATVPGPEQYLSADGTQVEAWRMRLAATDRRGLRVGLAWAGNPGTDPPASVTAERHGSLPPDRLAPLFGQQGVRFFSLQKGGPPAPDHVPLTDLMNEMADFADTAALITNLDLVISVDTAVAHLAAALGKPVWLLDRFDSGWRWLTGRRDSPWYPTLRLFRQPKPGDWDTVVEEVGEQLRLFARKDAAAANPPVDLVADTADHELAEREFRGRSVLKRHGKGIVFV